MRRFRRPPGDGSGHADPILESRDPGPRRGGLVRCIVLACLLAPTPAIWAQGSREDGRTRIDLAGVLDPEPAAILDIPGYLDAPQFLPDAPPTIEWGPIGTIAESLFGDVYAPDRWRPLPLRTFFSEGWLEPWASGPAGESGRTPRQGWLGSFAGVFYRLWLANLTDLHDVNKPYGGESYTGSYTIFLPFSRRFEMALGIPFVVANGTADASRGYRHDFGDMIIGARFLMAESKATTHTFNVDVRVPTGLTRTGGDLMALIPRYEFWINVGGPWVIRGGMNVSVPLNKDSQRTRTLPTPDQPAGFLESTSQTAFGGDLAIGRYFRPHDVPFGDLVFYTAMNLTVPFEDRNRPVYFGMGPGTRFHISNNWFFLHFWEFPMVGPRPFDYQMQVAILKSF